MTYGCIGEHLSHSFSKEIHARLRDYSYELYEIAPSDVEAFIKTKKFNAINVTIPYKQTVIPYLDEISEQAKEIGAVNTVVNRGGKLFGYNTDFFGMRSLIVRAGIDLVGKKVLILGSGGTSRTARAVARDLSAREIYTLSRKGGEGVITYEEAMTSHKDADVIINTTPVGMFPGIDDEPISIDAFLNLSGVVDAIYNPLRSRLVRDAQRRGIKAVGGLYMLVSQAAYASELFLDSLLCEGACDKVYRDILAEKENIVLIGMPGSGKTTVGKRIAKKLGRDFLDTDEIITEKIGKTPAEIIENEGEESFRIIEAKIIRDFVSMATGVVIATGGGAVLREENRENLKLNGRVYFLDRSIEKLAVTDNRPLSRSRELLEKRFSERYGIYTASADECIDGDGKISKIAEEIVERHRSVR